jgi:hypothetical protein
MIGSLLAVPAAGIAVSCAARLIDPLRMVGPFSLLVLRAVLGAGLGGATGVYVFGGSDHQGLTGGGMVLVVAAVAAPVVAARALAAAQVHRHRLPPLTSQRIPIR